MSATKILWGQIIVVFLIVLATTWGATEWTAWRLGFQPQLGQPWFQILGWPVYDPPDLFWWNHWEKTSHALLVGAILHVLYAEPDKTLAGVAALLSDPKRSRFPNRSRRKRAVWFGETGRNRCESSAAQASQTTEWCRW